MKKSLLVSVAAGLLLLSAAAPAEDYFVRNRPFKQVIKAGNEPLVGAEAFLRALDLNWTVNGDVVTLTDKPAANPQLSAGMLKFRYGQQEAAVEANPRGGSVFIPLRPMAKLLNYSVNVNTASRTVDVVRARFATDNEKKLVSELSAAQEAERIAKEEAWAKRAAELKAKRDAAKAAEEGTEEGTGDGEKPADGEKPKETASTTPTPVETPPTPPTPPAEEKKEEVPKEARLEVFNTIATPDPGNGTVLINCEIKNMGEAPSKPVSGTLILRGPDASASATNVNVPKSKVWWTTSISGPSIQPGASWPFNRKYSHPSGNSMPLGNIEAEFKLNSTK